MSSNSMSSAALIPSGLEFEEAGDIEGLRVIFRHRQHPNLLQHQQPLHQHRLQHQQRSSNSDIWRRSVGCRSKQAQQRARFTGRCLPHVVKSPLSWTCPPQQYITRQPRHTTPQHHTTTTTTWRCPPQQYITRQPQQQLVLSRFHRRSLTFCPGRRQSERTVSVSS